MTCQESIICVTYLVTVLSIPMKVGFPNGRTQRLFNDPVRLEARYGSDVAEKIALRMAVLAVAKNLAVVPTRSPIRLRGDGDSAGRFQVDLVGARRLVFTATMADTTRVRANSLIKIQEIEVIGVV